LDEFRVTHFENLAFSQCSECHTHFVLLDATATATAINRWTMTRRTMKNKVRYWGYVSRDAVSVTILVQLVIGMLGLLVFLFSSSSTSPVQEWSASCTTAACRIAICYGCGLAVLVFLLGLFGFCVLVGTDCSTRQAVEELADAIDGRQLGGPSIPPPSRRQRRRNRQNRSAPSSATGSGDGCCRGCCTGMSDCSGFCSGDDGGLGCLILLAIGAFLLMLGFVAGIVISVAAFHIIVRRLFWTHKKRQLAEQFPVKDRSTEDVELTGGAGTVDSDVESAAADAAFPAMAHGSISEQQCSYLKDLGLMEE
jgi:hypothetical protein